MRNISANLDSDLVLKDHKRAKRFKKILAHTREICEEVVSIHAVDVDSNSRFPHEAMETLKAVINCLRICGIAGYKNDTELSLGRLIRDILSAPIMINNDRLRNNCSILHASQIET